jgi:NAD(P)-dependent dehydrogenase (short-subunit alcohol dehydrogenase family)
MESALPLARNHSRPARQRCMGDLFEATSVSGLQWMVDETVAQFGRLDILVNGIGLNPEEKAEEVTEEMFDYVCDVNLKSAMFQAQAVALHMIRQGTGEKQVHLGSVRRDLEAVKLSMTTPWALALLKDTSTG